MYMPNGTYNRQGDAPWYPPTGPLATATLPLVLSPFPSHLGDYSVMKYIGFAARDRAPGQGQHVNSVTTFLSQAPAQDYGSPQCTVPGDSIDQVVANAFKKPNLVMSGGCQMGSVDSAPFNYSDYVSYKAGVPNEPHKNPVALFQSMFASAGSGGPAPGPQPPPRAGARNKSILDTAVADLADMQSRLGSTDRQKLDAYLTSFRALEARLGGGAAPPPSPECVPGAVPASALNNVDLDGNLSSTYIARVQAFFDMIVLAFRCDIVRSVSFMFDGDGGDRRNNACPPALLLPGADLSGGLHIGISHYGSLGSGGPGGRERAISRDRAYMSLFFYLLDGLKSVKDPSGATILDNTIVFNAYGIADGNHDPGGSDGTPVVVGGGKSFLRPGSSYDLRNADMTDLFFTFGKVLGTGITSFRGSSRALSI
jgi:hypothetical protein